MTKQKKTAVQRAAELLRENRNLKYYEAMEQARREVNEMDRGATPGVPGQKK